MARAIRITAEQYLALLDLGVPALCTVAVGIGEADALKRLLANQQSNVKLRWRKEWAETTYHHIFWTLVDAE